MVNNQYNYWDIDKKRRSQRLRLFYYNMSCQIQKGLKSFVSKIFERQNLQKSAIKNGKTIVAEYLAKNPKAKEIQPFCQKIWSEADLKRYRRCRITGNVTHHGYLNGINHHLTTGVNPKGLTEQFLCTGITPKAGRSCWTIILQHDECSRKFIVVFKKHIVNSY